MSSTSTNNQAKAAKKPKAKKVNRGAVKSVKGMQDWQPEPMALRERIFSTIVESFRRHGAVRIQTPILELKGTLTGKYGEDTKLIYELADQGGESTALRYDLTVPFARYAGTHGVQSIKRYQLGRVYRRDQPSKGRYREFFQCDFDIAGVYGAMLPDAECCQLLMETLDRLELPDFVLKVNHRRLLDAMFQACGVPADNFTLVCSSIDKLDKMTADAVVKELVETKGQPAAVIGKLMELLNAAPSDSARGTLEWLQTSSEFAVVRESEQSADACAAAIGDLALLCDYVDAFGYLAQNRLRIELSLARGLDYYTGIIMEAVYQGPDAVGSIAGGGRYDGLVGMFSKKEVPSVGFSLGVERIYTILDERQKREGVVQRADSTQVFVCSVGDKACAAQMTRERMRVLAELWKADIAAAMYQGANPKFQPQLKRAGQTPVVVLFGEDELKANKVKLKCNLRRDIRDIEVERSDMIAKIRETLQMLETTTAP